MGASDQAAASSTARGFADSAGQEKQGGTREEQGGEMKMGERSAESRDLEICQQRGLVHRLLHASGPRATD